MVNITQRQATTRVVTLHLMEALNELNKALGKIGQNPDRTDEWNLYSNHAAWISKIQRCLADGEQIPFHEHEREAKAGRIVPAVKAMPWVGEERRKK